MSEKLPAEFKKKWVEALRSGEYEQGRGSLKTEDGKYCCLGVACVIAGDEPGAFGMPDAENHPHVPAKLSTVDVAQNKRDLLAVMNDTGKTFAEIADWIEKKL